MYTVRVVSDGASVGQGSTTCTTSPCLYVQQVSAFATNYTIFVASINGDGAVGPESIMSLPSHPSSSTPLPPHPSSPSPPPPHPLPTAITGGIIVCLLGIL